VTVVLCAEHPWRLRAVALDAGIVSDDSVIEYGDMPIVAQTLPQQHTEGVGVDQANLLQRCSLPSALVPHHSKWADYPPLDVCNAPLAHGVLDESVELAPAVGQLAPSRPHIVVDLLRPLPHAQRRRLHRVQARKAVGAEDVIPVPDVVFERDRLLEDGAQYLPIGLRGGLAQQQPLQLVLVARIVPRAIFLPISAYSLRKPLRARGAAAREVGPLQCLEDAICGHKARLGACRRREALDQRLQMGNARSLGRVVCLRCRERREAPARRRRRQLQPVELAVNAADLAVND
jgi:hypothetical protein